MRVNAGAHPSSSMAFSADGKTVAFGGSGKIYLWNTETESVLDIPLSDRNDIHENPQIVNKDGDFALPLITALAFSPDGTKLVSGTMGGKVQMWDAETGVELAPFLQGQDRDPITTLAFSSNGTLIAVGSERKIRLLGSSKQPRLKDIPRGTKSLAFSPDDTVLVAGLRNGSIELWDMTTGEKITTLNGHTSTVETLVFSPDGKTLVSTGHDGTILLWDWEEALKGAPIRDE